MIAFTDGACSKNGQVENTGGFGVVILDDDQNFIDCYQKVSKNTTNNREELRAILYVLLRFGKERPIPIVYSDSAYCVNALNQWIYGWANSGWLKSDKKPPENLDIFMAFYEYFNKGYKIDLRKIPGHAGIEWNEIADQLATNKVAAAEIRRRYYGR